jgi:FkbH-like protein
MKALYEELGWLPRSPQDFNARCRAIGAGAEDWGAQVAALARYALTEPQLHKLAAVIGKSRAQSKDSSPLVPFELGVLSNATTELIVPAIVATAARYEILMKCVTGGYGQVMQGAVGDDSEVHGARPQAILVSVDYRGLPLVRAPGDAARAGQSLAAARDYLLKVIHGIRAHGNAVVILCTLARPPETLCGGLDFVLKGTLRNLIDATNRMIGELAESERCVVFDVAGVAETVGLADWHDPVAWHVGRQPFANRFVPLYAEHLCRLIAALRGQSRKVLVLDLDNTLWGGIVGDDGVEGIQIAEGDPVGEGHRALQRTALDFHDRGVVLAVASKNEESNARRPFQAHPEMLLREAHIAAFRANWQDKAENLLAIAQEINVSAGALVFVDDNPFERNAVRDRLPQVAVPELPTDSAYYARTVLAGGYFEATALTAEDLERARFYTRRTQFRERALASGDLDAYLRSLAMAITIRPFDDAGRARIVQLINKTNQFNLTTIRYSEEQVIELERNPAYSTFQVRFRDLFGDAGMICVVICRRESEVWFIDGWLMSCRVIGRNVELAVLQELVSCARQLGIRRIVGEYRPTEKNALVATHYALIGFTLVGRDDSGVTQWSLDVAEAPTERETFIAVDALRSSRAEEQRLVDLA